MNDLTPRAPRRPLLWPDTVYDLQAFLSDRADPVYIVGGAVRDAYLHRPVEDIDLATAGSGITLARQIADAFDADVFVMDAERDVARVLLNTAQTPTSPGGRVVIDVARFRADDLLADLTDRDFTMNALAVDLRGDLGKVIDPLNGESDLADRIVRRCSPDAIAADAARALRAIRQSVQFNARIEPQTLADVRAAAPLLDGISPERVRDELIKTLKLSRPGAALRVAEVTGLLTVMLPELDALHGLQEPSPHIYDGWKHTLSVTERLHDLMTVINPQRGEESVASFDYGTAAVALDPFRDHLQAHLRTEWPNERSHRALLLLTALLHEIGKPHRQRVAEGDIDYSGFEAVSAEMAGERVTQLRLSNGERDRVTTIIAHQSDLYAMPAHLDDLSIHRFWYNLGAAGVDICLLTLADHLGTVGSHIKQDPWLLLIDHVRKLIEAYYTRHEEVVAPPPLLDGTQLMEALDLQPGKEIGTLLTLIREGQVMGTITTIEEALNAARAHLSG